MRVEIVKDERKIDEDEEYDRKKKMKVKNIIDEDEDNKYIKIKKRKKQNNKSMDIEYNNDHANKMDEEHSNKSKMNKKNTESQQSRDRSLSGNNTRHHNYRVKTRQNYNILDKMDDVKDNKTKIEYQDKFAQALNHLSENYSPDTLTCRDKEKKVIRDFIESGLKNMGNSQTLCKIYNKIDVSGVPGLGKTACILEIINDLRNNGYDFSFFVLNGLKFKRQSDIYVDLFYNIFGYSINNESACKELGILI